MSTRSTKRVTAVIPAVIRIETAQPASVADSVLLQLHPGKTATETILDAYRPDSGPHVSFDAHTYRTITGPLDKPEDLADYYRRESRIHAMWLAVHGTSAQDYPAHLWDLLVEMLTNEMADYIDYLPARDQSEWFSCASRCNLDAKLANFLIQERASRRGSTTPF